MKRSFLIIYFSIFTFSIFTFSFVYAGELKKLTFEQAYLGEGEKILNPLPNITGWADDTHYFQLEEGKLFKVDARTGKQKLALDPDAPSYAETLKPLGEQANLLAALDRSNDLNKFLLMKEGDIFLFQRDKHLLIRVTETKGEEKTPAFSPDGNKIAYTMDGDLYVYRLETGKSSRLTADGSKEILNGYASWVYYEEILGRENNYKAFWWSPDSDKIVFMRFDQTEVPIFSIVDSRGIYGNLEQTHFPKVGYPNPKVKLGIARIEDNTVRWIPLNDESDHYLALPQWNTDSTEIYFQWLNREQNHLKILRYSLLSNAIETAYRETRDTWVDFFDNKDYGSVKINDFCLLSNGDFITRSSRSGWHHLYYIHRDGRERQLTSGDWPVTSISHVDEKKRIIYFSAAMEDSTARGVYKTGFQGGKITKLTSFKGLHMELVSPGGGYFTDRYSSVDAPERLDLRDSSGKLVRLLGDSASAKLQEYALAKVELFRIDTEDGYALPALRLLPPDFDKSKKYPVVINIYGGPGAPVVFNSFMGFRDHFLAQQGIIVMYVDHRGSGHFGKKGMDLMYRNFGKWEMHDYIQAVKYLRTLPYVDSEKIGITGGSYGGYVTAMALTYGADYFQYGIANYGGYDWRLYDTVYTERYMDTPADNPEGYDNACVFKYIDKYKGMLRITHGDMDNNAHMQSTLQLMDKLQDAGKTFEFMLYPGQRHGYRGKKRIASRKADLDFWMRRFFGKTLMEINTDKKTAPCP
ncbi:MAG: DPP IV N-terminal domain-containing protein [Candidatus Aminicenantes bacterium]|nr:DPP IV N-terminal domain-containing protein [Candidatus Aminicenantes bacterium]